MSTRTVSHTRRTQPNARMLHVAANIEHNLALLVTQALEHIRRELDFALDSYPTSVPGASDPVATGYQPATCQCCAGAGCDACKPVTLNLVERQANARFRLRSQREQIRDDVAMFEDMAAGLIRVCRDAIGIRIPLDKPACYAGPELAGYLIALADDGWHDPICTNLSRTNGPGLCDACRKRMERWRARTGQKELDDDRTVDHDSVVELVNGVAHVDPARGAA